MQARPHRSCEKWFPGFAVSGNRATSSSSLSSPLYLTASMDAKRTLRRWMLCGWSVRVGVPTYCPRMHVLLQLSEHRQLGTSSWRHGERKWVNLETVAKLYPTRFWKHDGEKQHPTAGSPYCFKSEWILNGLAGKKLPYHTSCFRMGYAPRVLARRMDGLLEGM